MCNYRFIYETNPGRGMDQPSHNRNAETDRNSAPAVSRAVAVLRLLAKTDAPLGVHAIARAVGLVPSTALHVLRALVREELVSFDEQTKRYAMDAGVLTIAGRWLSRNPFPQLAQPILDAWASQHGVTAIGVQAQSLDHFVVVAIAHSQNRMQLHTDVGSRFPALISATGRCIAAFGQFSDAEIEARFSTLRWDKPPSFAAWRREVADAARNGFAIDVGNYMAGITVVSAPVFGEPDRMTHALVAVGTTDHIEISGKTALIRDICEGARQISDRLQDAPRAVHDHIGPVSGRTTRNGD